MATLTIRNLPDPVRDALRVRAAGKGRSMEAEAREALARLYRPEPAAAEPPWVGERVLPLQEAMRSYRLETAGVVDEFLAERREEARRENEREPTRQHAPEREKQVERLGRARAILRRRVPEGTSLVDEFLTERRDMWGEA